MEEKDQYYYLTPKGRHEVIVGIVRDGTIPEFLRGIDFRHVMGLSAIPRRPLEAYARAYDDLDFIGKAGARDSLTKWLLDADPDYEGTDTIRDSSIPRRLERLQAEGYIVRGKLPDTVPRFKFAIGDRAEVVPRCKTTVGRFKAWEGRIVEIVARQQREGQVEYRVKCSNTGKSRWIYSDALEKV